MKVQSSFWHSARFVILLLLILLVTFSSHPAIVMMSRAAGMKSGTILSRYILVVFAGLFLLCMNIKSMLSPKTIRVLLLVMMIIIVLFFITRAIWRSKAMLSDITSIGMCLAAIMIGWQLNLSKREMMIMSIVYAGSILFVGLSQIFTNIGGFIIKDQYFADNKNSLGVMMAVGGIILTMMAFSNQHKKMKRFLYYGFSILMLVCMLTIRSRAAYLAFILVIMLMFRDYYHEIKLSNNFIIGFILILAVLFFLPQSVYDYAFNSFFQNQDTYGITSGRSDRNRAALRVLSQYPLRGNMFAKDDVGWVHNYPLNRAFEFGLVFCLPILIAYLYLMVQTVKRALRASVLDYNNVGFFALLIPFIISFAEPTFPFGPGTATVMCYILFGISLKNNEIKSRGGQ